MVGVATATCPDWLKQAIHARDGRECQYCGTAQATHYVVEHVVPVDRGGPHDTANLVMACASCNIRKGGQVWLPRNFDVITQAHPEWAVRVRAMAVSPIVARVTTSFRISENVKKEFARFAKWRNRDADPIDEIDVGQLAEDALVAYMRANGWEV